ncbi:MAG TPA: hypothetical protein DER09_07155 [Prolixibacteraceae bacterium]|nr:hypothetical protein [Prolixibacteraceae bacterium]
MRVRYITDGYGNQSAVVIPIADWNALNERLTKIQNKLKILTGLEDAVDEVNLAREDKLELKTLRDFLDEN